IFRQSAALSEIPRAATPTPEFRQGLFDDVGEVRLPARRLRKEERRGRSLDPDQGDGGGLLPYGVRNELGLLPFRRGKHSPDDAYAAFLRSLPAPLGGFEFRQFLYEFLH